MHIRHFDDRYAINSLETKLKVLWRFIYYITVVVILYHDHRHKTYIKKISSCTILGMETGKEYLSRRRH